MGNAPAGVRGAGDSGVSSGVRTMQLICWPLRLGLGGLFLFAAYNKLKPDWGTILGGAKEAAGAAGKGVAPAGNPWLSGPQNFSAAVQAFKIPLPDVLVRLSTAAVPWVEIVASLCLIFGFWLRGAATAIAALLVVFIVLIVQALARHLNVECGCFGDMSPFCPKKVGTCHIIQDVVMLGAALFIMATPRTAKVGKLTPADLRR